MPDDFASLIAKDTTENDAYEAQRNRRASLIGAAQRVTTPATNGNGTKKESWLDWSKRWGMRAGIAAVAGSSGYVAAPKQAVTVVPNNPTTIISNANPGKTAGITFDKGPLKPDAIPEPKKEPLPIITLSRGYGYGHTLPDGAFSAVLTQQQGPSVTQWIASGQYDKGRAYLNVGKSVPTGKYRLLYLDIGGTIVGEETVNVE